MREDKRGQVEEAEVARKLLRATWRLDRLMAEEMDDGLRITEIRLRAPREVGEDILATVKAVTVEGKRFVGFHGALSSAEAIRGAVERINNATLKWREDRPYGG